MYYYKKALKVDPEVRSAVQALAELELEIATPELN